MSEEVIPVVLFVVMGVVLCVMFWLRYKARAETQQTFRAALDKGQELTPEIIDRLGSAKPKKDQDLRYGIVWLALAAGLVLIGFTVPEPEALRGTLAGASLPFSIGIAYLLMHKITDRD